MTIPSSQTSGFTFVELLVVFALLAIMSALMLQGFVGYGQVQQHRQVTSDVTSLFYTARQQSQTLTANDAYGVMVTGNTVALFAQSATTTPVRTITIPSTYNVTAAFTSGESHLTFARRSGVPSTLGVVTIFDTQRQATTTITVLPSGLVE